MGKEALVAICIRSLTNIKHTYANSLSMSKARL